MTTTDNFGRDARSIMGTLNSIKDPGTLEEAVKEKSEKIRVINK